MAAEETGAAVADPAPAPERTPEQKIEDMLFPEAAEQPPEDVDVTG